MVVSELCSSVDAIRAFLEHLVDPMLPQKPIQDDPPLSQQQKIAKQVHSVVLLYNYYHRKQNQELEFVAFREFCKLIVDMRPALFPYMKFTVKPNETDLVDVEEELSLTEKAITSSYDICMILDPSRSVPNIEGWPISKVAVLLVDSKKENCFLRFCSATGGVWSLIENDVDTSGQVSEVTRDVKSTYQKRRVIKKSSKDGLNEGRILEVGYSAVKEAAGVNSIDITLLKSYTVYSQSKEKTASRFYIMKSSKLISEGFVQVPIKDLVKSFRGPLVKRSSSSWKVTSVVEHFHVLPYSEIISEWISREAFSDSLQDSKPAEKQLLTCGVTESRVSSEGMSFGLDNKPCCDTIEALNQKETNGVCSDTRCDTVKKDQDMDMSNSLVFQSKIKEECQPHIANTLQVSEDKKIENPSTQHHSYECNDPREVEKVVSTRMHITPSRTKDNISESIEKCTLIADNSNTDLEKVQISIDSKGKMDVSDVCPTVDAVRAFLEQLVDPMLLAKPSTCDDPPLSQQQRVAKQVHSVVLLYNYYHRKQHPELAFVAFKEFCKLAVDLSPALLTYMKFTQKPDETDLVDVEQQLSLTEKVIMSSCDICTCLDASKNIPNIEGWPISKVSVLLVDSKKEICFLLFSSITDGVWSVIEKDVDSSGQNSAVTDGVKHAYKKRRVIKKPTKHALNVNEDGFLQIGYSSVKEITGVNSIDVMLLGSYTVYSQSKEKTASRFYIMKCLQSTDVGFIQVPMKDLIQSFRGPLVKRSSSSWTVSPVVEYFHVLPYSEIISEWFSRETFSNSLQDSKLADEQFPKLVVTELYTSSEGVSIGLDNKPCDDTTEAINQKENNGCGTIKWHGYVKEAKDMDVDNSIVFPSKNKEESKHIVKILHASEDQKVLKPSVQHHSNERTSPHEAKKVVSTRTHITEGGIKDASSFDKICANTTSENESVEKCTLIENNSNIDLEKFRIFIASKGKILSETAIKVLIRKRNALTLQQRKIEDAIAVCNMKIQKWLIGEEDDMELKIESIIDGCNDTCLRNQGRTCQSLEGHQCLLPSVKRKRLAEAMLSLQTPCQELDDICHINNWILPIYKLSQSDGKFQANVKVKGLDFENSCEGKPCSFPHEARDSAAAQMLTNLRRMAKSDI